MVELKWLIGISIIVCLFCSVTVEAQTEVDTTPNSQVVSRDFDSNIKIKNHTWIVSIKYIKNIEPDSFGYIIRDYYNVTRSFSTYEWSKYQIYKLVDQTEKIWIKEGKKLITETSYIPLPGDKIPDKVEKEMVEEIPVAEPKNGFGTDFLGILTEQKSIVYMFSLFIVILILLVMKLDNPLIMIIGIAGVTAIFWILSSEEVILEPGKISIQRGIPLIIPAALILFFFVFSAVGGKK